MTPLCRIAANTDVMKGVKCSAGIPSALRVFRGEGIGGGIVPRWVSSLACRSWIRFDRLGAAMGGTNVSQLPTNSGWPNSMGPAMTRGQKTQLD